MSDIKKFVLAAVIGSSLIANTGFAFPVQTAVAPENTLNLTVSAIMSARQSILLNGNRQTIAEILKIAAAERLPIQARIANLRAMGVAYIHNKGVIVDGVNTLISSINWTQNAIQNNREAAVLLTSPGVAQYYGSYFERDWNQSAGF